MLEITFLQGLWFLLIAVLILGYFVLDGFDLGIGVLYPFIAKTESDKAYLRRAIGPVWDGNEVWLLTAGGALFAAFAPAYATSFSGFYLAIMLVLFGLIIRAVSLEFRSNTRNHHALFDTMFFIGSLVPALLFGVAIGNILQGLPLNEAGNYMGGLIPLLNPFGLICGLLGLSACVALGASWIMVKMQQGSDLYAKAKSIKLIAIAAVLVLWVIACIMYFAYAAGNPFATDWALGVGVVFALVGVAGALFSIVLGNGGKDIAAHIALSLVCVGLIGCMASGLFPCLIPATDPALSITIANAAASEYGLTCMTIITCICLPLVLIYHVIIYRTYRGKLTEADIAH